MADPQKSGPRRSEALPGAEDEARIENLLVTGLDHYFAGEFEQAINLWTRVLFLDRMRSFETLTYLEEYSRYHTKRGDEDDEDE